MSQAKKLLGVDSRRVRGRFVTAAALRKRKQRAAIRSRGFVLRSVWVHPKDWPMVRKKIRALFVGRMGKQRGARK